MSRILILVFGLLMPVMLHGAEETAPALKASVESLVTQLGDDHFDKRNEATAAIIKLGKPAIPELQAAQNTTKDPEIKSRLLDILEILQPPLEMIVQPLGEAKAGQLLTFKIRIKNVSPQLTESAALETVYSRQEQTVFHRYYSKLFLVLGLISVCYAGLIIRVRSCNHLTR